MIFPTSHVFRSDINPLRELRLTWAYIRYDFSTTVIPALLFTLAAARHAQLGAVATLGAASLSLAYFTLYIYVFSLANQLAGVDEDRRNKPDRPIPAGLVTYEGTQLRLGLAMILFALLGQALGVAIWMALWVLVVLLYNRFNWSSHWSTKNLCMSLGVLAQLSAAWQIVAPLSQGALIWLGMLALVIFPLVTLQDLRDTSGDRAIGRRTFPLIFGQRAAHLFLALGFGLLPILTHATILRVGGNTSAALLCDAILAVLSLWIAARLLLRCSPAGDHRTYMLFTYWYCAALATGIVIL